MSIQDRVIAIIAEQAVLEPSDVTLDSTLDSLGIDSLGLVELIFAIEEEFDISVPFNANEPSAISTFPPCARSWTGSRGWWPSSRETGRHHRRGHDQRAGAGCARHA